MDWKIGLFGFLYLVMTVLTKLGGSSNFSDIPDKVSFKSAENPPPPPLNFYSPNKSNMFKNK